MTERANIRLDDQAREDARIISVYYNLKSSSAAVRYALREVARRIEAEEKAAKQAAADGSIGN